jgi:predicted DNA-binding transcriptional regulator AlpA
MQTQHSTIAREAASRTGPGKVPESISRFDQLPDSALIGSDAVRGLVGDVTSVTLWRWVRSGEFPAPRKLPCGRLNAWKVADIRRYLGSTEANHETA